MTQPLILMLARSADPEPALAALSTAGLDVEGVHFVLSSYADFLDRYAASFDASRLHVFEYGVERRDADSYDSDPSDVSWLFHLTAAARLFPQLRARSVLIVLDSLRSIFWRVDAYHVTHQVSALSISGVLDAAADFLRTTRAPLMLFPSSDPSPGAVLVNADLPLRPEFEGVHFALLCTQLSAGQQGSPLPVSPLPLVFDLDPEPALADRVAYPRAACRSGTRLQTGETLSVDTLPGYSQPLSVPEGS